MEGIITDSRGRSVSLGEIRKAYLIDATKGVFVTFKRLRNLARGSRESFWDLDTEDNGAVICRDYYTSWEFVAPAPVTISQSGTVADVISRIRAYAEDTPPGAWDEFAVWISSGIVCQTINEFLEDGVATVIRDAGGTGYAGTQRDVTACASFLDAIDWMTNCMGSEFLASDGSNVFATDHIVTFSIETTEEPIEGIGNATLSFSFRF